MPVGDQQSRIGCRFMPVGLIKLITIVPLVWRFILMHRPLVPFADLGCHNLPLHKNAPMIFWLMKLEWTGSPFAELMLLKMGYQPLLGKFLKTVLVLMIVLPH